MHTIIKKNWQSRFPSKVINIGDIALGGNNPVRVQSMTNTSTQNIKDTTNQCFRIIEAGSDFVRVSVPNVKSAGNLAEIKKNIRAAGYNTPVIADIHFNPEVALVSARIAEKIRINPGNYGTKASFNKSTLYKNDYDNELKQIHENISPLLKVCKEYGTAVRIGTNHGSLSPRILCRYGNTAEGMVNATLEYVKIFESLGFYNTVISLKSSNPLVMINAYRLIAESLLNQNIQYPLHIGVTEAGAGEEGRIRSAAGICPLLEDGIGDTIRVSLSEDPEKEIPFAKKIANAFQKKHCNTSIEEKPKVLGAEKFEILEEIRKRTDNKPFEKPVVIDSCDKFEKHARQASENIKHEQLPDFIFCKTIKDAYETGYIMPFALWKEQDKRDVYPMFDMSEINEAVKTNSSIKFFQVAIEEVSEDELKSLSSAKGAVLILNIDFESDNELVIRFISRLYQNGSATAILKAVSQKRNWEEFIVEVCRTFGYLSIERIIGGIWIESETDANRDKTIRLAYSLLQATGVRITTAQYISCPTCARTSFDLQKVLKEVKDKTQHMKGIKIAVMGCIVNGPGEMADADYGLVGAGNAKIHLYKKREIIKRSIEQENAASELVKVINENRD